jgi:hypothetical protein
MTAAALVIMIPTWVAITAFTLYYFIKVVRTPQEKGAAQDEPAAERRDPEA